jgi:hypothetical protein
VKTEIDGEKDREEAEDGEQDVEGGNEDVGPAVLDDLPPK